MDDTIVASTVAKITLVNDMIANRRTMLAKGLIICMQIFLGLWVKMCVVYIEPPHKQLLYFSDMTLRHVGPHTMSVKIVYEGARYAPTTCSYKPEI